MGAAGRSCAPSHPRPLTLLSEVAELPFGVPCFSLQEAAFPNKILISCWFDLSTSGAELGALFLHPCMSSSRSSQGFVYGTAEKRKCGFLCLCPKVDLTQNKTSKL